MQYNQPYGTAANSPYINGNPATGTPGSIPPAESIEYPQREIVNLITDAGFTPTNSDLHQLAKAVQSGLLNYHLDSGTANNYAVLLAPNPGSYFAGLFCVAKIANDNTGPSVLNITSLGNKNIVHRDGSALVAGELKAGGLYAFHYDGTNFQLVWSTNVAGAPVFLTAARTFYVNSSTGNDTFDGTAASVGGGHGPFATLARAATEVAKYNLNGFNITVNVAAGTYAGAVLPSVAGAGNVQWVGDTTTPANVSIAANVSGSPAISASGIAHIFSGFKVSNSSGPGVGITARGVLILGNMEFGACVGPQTICTYGATLRYNGTAYKITGSATDGAGGPGSFLYAYQGAIVETSNIGSPPTLTLTGTPNFQTAFVVAGGISSTFVIWSSISGSATGVRYSGDDVSVLRVAGGGPTHYPGNASGVLAHGAQYY